MTITPADANADKKALGRNPLPLFYSKPVPIGPETFKDRSLARGAKLEFARKTNSVPLNAVEFALAQRSYPIVFTLEDNPFPLAILGLHNEHNSFLDDDGRWRGDAYVPAYVRRVPFLLMSGPGDKQLTLCADIASDLVVPGNANPFYNEGKPTEIVKKAMTFCTAFQSEFEKTRQFCAALAEQDVLESKNAEVRLADGKKAVLGPFKIVDKTKFAALPDRVIADWHKRDWLSHVHAHLFSSANWDNLVKRSS